MQVWVCWKLRWLVAPNAVGRLDHPDGCTSIGIRDIFWDRLGTPVLNNRLEFVVHNLKEHLFGVFCVRRRRLFFESVDNDRCSPRPLLGRIRATPTILYGDVQIEPGFAIKAHKAQGQTMKAASQ